MKKYLKKIIKILLFPILIVFNPFIPTLFLKFKNLLISFYYSLFYFRSFDKFCVLSSATIVGSKYMRLNGKCIFRKFPRLECLYNYPSNINKPPLLEIGSNTSFGDYCHIGCINKIIIGDDSIFGSNVLIEDHNHGDYSHGIDDSLKRKASLFSKGPIIIGKNVWVGDNVCILAGVTIGDNSVIGAGSVVTKDVEPNSIYAGNPAHIIRKNLE